MEAFGEQTIMTATEKDTEEEFKFALQMKKEYCDESGKETRPAKAAEIMHKIGVIYRKRSPDKICLIKSAGLFNAAIVRNPSNISQVKSDLSEICLHILQQAKAKNRNANLIKQAEQVKTAAKKLRNEVEKHLKTVSVPRIASSTPKHNMQNLNNNKISAIKEINKIIAGNYTQIMAELSQFCEEVMGKPPCEYVIAGMGSLAREEITPYSDFEHIILLHDDVINYETCLEYFRWFSVIFHIVVLNVQETILPSLNICSLNGKHSVLNDWFFDAITPRGISFDGMMPHACKFPLGRQQHTSKKQFTNELIKRVSDMLRFLTSEENLKNGYHLAEILTKTCYVFGNKRIFTQFVNDTERFLETNSDLETISDIRAQVKDDLNNFSTRFRLTDLKNQKTINIKQLVYRSTTIFVTVLARIHKVFANSCFDMIYKMKADKHISEYAAHKMECAIAIACETRLRVYMKHKSQHDNAIDLTQNDAMNNFLNIVGRTSTVNYFQIAYCLQCEVAKQLNITNHHFYFNPKLINITIGLAFKINNFTTFEEDAEQKQRWDSTNFDFDSCLKELERDMNLYKNLFEKFIEFIKPREHSMNSDFLTRLNDKEIEFIVAILQSENIHDEAVEVYTYLLDVHLQKSTNIDGNGDIARVNFEIAVSLNCLNQATDALNYLEKALEINQQITLDASNDRKIARTYYEIGVSHRHLRERDHALNNFNQALKIFQNSTQKAQKNMDIAKTLYAIGACHTDFLQFVDALNFLCQSLNIYENISSNAEKDKDIAQVLHEIGHCHYNLGQYDLALKHLNRALEINQNASFNADIDRDIASTLRMIGLCYMELHRFDVALDHLQRFIDIQKKIALDLDKDVIWKIGLCHKNMTQFDLALTVLSEALKEFKSAAVNPDTDKEIAQIFSDMSDCHRNLNQHDLALKELHKAVEIFEKMSLNANTDKNIAKTLHKLSTCHTDLNQFAVALKLLNRAFQIYQNNNLDADKDIWISLILYEIGRCYYNMQQYDGALNHANKALEINRNGPSYFGKDGDIATTLCFIGFCHTRMHHYDDALSYLNQSLGIQQTKTLYSNEGSQMARTKWFIGYCHKNKNQYDLALTFLNRALEIFQSISFSIETDKDIAQLNSDIRDCQTQWRQFRTSSAK